MAEDHGRSSSSDSEAALSKTSLRFTSAPSGPFRRFRPKPSCSDCRARICSLPTRSGRLKSYGVTLSRGRRGGRAVPAIEGAAPAGADFQAIVAALLQLKGEDATKAWLKGLKDNVVSAAIGQRVYYYGYLPVYILYAMSAIGPEKTMAILKPYLSGDKNDNLDTGADVVTPDNLAAYQDYLNSLGIKSQ